MRQGFSGLISHSCASPVLSRSNRSVSRTHFLPLKLSPILKTSGTPKFRGSAKGTKKHSALCLAVSSLSSRSSLPSYTMDHLPSYDQVAADTAAPEYEEPDPNEQSATTRIAIRRGTQNRLANERYGDIKALLDIKVNQTSGSAKQLLVSWRDKLLRLLRQPDKDDSFNFYTTSNYAKIDRQIRILVGRNLVSFFHVAFLNSSTNANAKQHRQRSLACQGLQK